MGNRLPLNYEGTSMWWEMPAYLFDDAAVLLGEREEQLQILLI